MSLALCATPSSAASRGDATIQPAYFTSSLFVDALRTDLQELVRVYSEDYYRLTDSDGTRLSAPAGTLRGPFALFKDVWIRQGWQWLHLKVFEPRARGTFVNVVLRLFLECATQAETPLKRVVGLFGLYAFYMSQPSSSTPRVHQTTGIPISIDNLELLLEFPASLGSSEEKALKPHVIYILQTLHPTFLALPQSTMHAENPRSLPREIVALEAETERGSSTGKKKMGRPSRAEKAQRLRAAVSGLDRWLEKSSYPAETEVGMDTEENTGASTTHIMLSQRPKTSRDEYEAKKEGLKYVHPDALGRAGSRVLARLKEIDTAAAERGLDVGMSGGELSGIRRIESAVAEKRMLDLLKSGGT
ncbi:hypothetical protein M0805_000961 [Coniferiporia weirii]|nr:hypothetical protein M0805_000961 [Coniferiporia weirii]